MSCVGGFPPTSLSTISSFSLPSPDCLCRQQNHNVKLYLYFIYGEMGEMPPTPHLFML